MSRVLTSKKSQAEDQTRAGYRWVLQRDPYVLAQLIAASRFKEKPESNTLDDAFHLPLCEYMQTTPYALNLYLVSRDHMKTTCITVARNVQRILKDPQIRILIGSNKAENAQGMLTEIKVALTIPQLVWAFPDILWPDPEKQSEKWTTSEIVVKRRKGPKEWTVETTGTEGEVTSRHYDHATFDDLVGKENTGTRDQLLTTISWYQAAQSLMDPKATQDVVGTIWAQGDLYMWLIQQWRTNGLKMGIYRQPCYRTTHDPIAAYQKYRQDLAEWEAEQKAEMARV